MTLRHKSLFCVDLSLSLRGSCLCSRQDSRRLEVLHCWPLPATTAHNFTTVGEFLLFYTQQKISFLYMISHGFKSNENNKSWSDCLVESVSTFAHMTFIHGCMNAYKISLKVCMCVWICLWVCVGSCMCMSESVFACKHELFEYTLPMQFCGRKSILGVQKDEVW